MDKQMQLFQERIPGFSSRVLGKLANDNAKNLSDSEIERILSNCVSPSLMIGYAKEIRDQGILTEAILEQCKAEISKRD